MTAEMPTRLPSPSRITWPATCRTGPRIVLTYINYCNPKVLFSIFLCYEKSLDTLKENKVSDNKLSKMSLFYIRNLREHKSVFGGDHLDIDII